MVSFFGAKFVSWLLSDNKQIPLDVTISLQISHTFWFKTSFPLVHQTKNLAIFSWLPSDLNFFSKPWSVLSDSNARFSAAILAPSSAILRCSGSDVSLGVVAEATTHLFLRNFFWFSRDQTRCQKKDQGLFRSESESIESVKCTQSNGDQCQSKEICQQPRIDLDSTSKKFLTSDCLDPDLKPSDLVQSYFPCLPCSFSAVYVDSASSL